MSESNEIIDATVVDGEIEPIRIADCELTAHDLSVVVISLKYVVSVANEESNAQLVPIVEKLEKMLMLAKQVP